MNNLKKMFTNKYKADPVESILSTIADYGLMQMGQKPTYVDRMNQEYGDIYQRDIDAQKALEERQRQDQLMGLKLNEDARAGEKMMRDADQKALENEQSLAFTDSILAQYPELQAKNVTGDDLIKLANLIETQKTRRFYQNQSSKDRQDEISNRFDLNKLEGLSKRVEKSGVPEIEGSLNVVESLISGKSDIPGVGMIDSLKPDWATSEEGKTIRRNIAGAANQILKSRSGAAVTDPEYARFLNEAMTGKFTSEASLKSGLVKMRQDLLNIKGAIAKGYEPKIVKMYEQNTGDFNLGTNAGSKHPIKKLYSKSRNQTKIIYSDGTEEVLDGQR